MNRIPQRKVFDTAPVETAVTPPPADAKTATDAQADSPAEQKSPKVKQDRVTFYAPPETVEHLDDLLYLASKRGKEMKIRDRTHIVRALVEAFRRSGRGLGSCLTEEELIESLTRQLGR
jgi:hypothetical protein